MILINQKKLYSKYFIYNKEKNNKQNKIVCFIYYELVGEKGGVK